MQEIVIWDSIELPIENSQTRTMLWRSYCESSCSTAVSIPLLIEENSDALRSRYLAWVYELGESKINGRRFLDHLNIKPNFSYWWMTLLVEKCNFAKSPQINDAIRLFALEDWVNQESINKIKLVSSNKHLAESLEIWSESSGIAFVWQDIPEPTKPISWVKRIYRSLPNTLQALVWMIKYMTECWPLRGVGLDEWKQSEGKITFVSYLFNLVPEAVSEGYFESRYWTRLPAVLADEGVKTNWLHIYVKDELIPNSKQAANAIRSFNDNSDGLQAHITLSSFLSFRVVKQTLNDWFRLRKVCRDVETELRELQMARYLWPLFREDWRDSIFGQTAMSNLLMLNLFESAMSPLPTQKKGVYLQENQGWEFGLIQAWMSGGHQGLIGFPHSTVRYWDLRYFFDSRTYVRTEVHHIPLPDRIACNGTAALEAYRTGGYPSEELIEVESLRYLYLAETTANGKTTIPFTGRRLLVVGDFLAINTHKQLRLLERAVPFLQEGTAITLKPHPACPIDPAQYPQSIMNIETKPLGELMDQYDIVYASTTTSAAVDAYCAGLPVITLLDGTDLNLSPLRGCDGVAFVSSPEELAMLVNNTHTEDSEEVQGQDYFYLNPELSRWRQLLMDNTNV